MMRVFFKHKPAILDFQARDDDGDGAGVWFSPCTLVVASSAQSFMDHALMAASASANCSATPERKNKTKSEIITSSGPSDFLGLFFFLNNQPPLWFLSSADRRLKKNIKKSPENPVGIIETS